MVPIHKYESCIHDPDNGVIVDRNIRPAPLKGDIAQLVERRIRPDLLNLCTLFIF